MDGIQQVTGSFVTKSSLSVTIRYPNSTVTATGAYDPSFDTVTGLDLIAGTYTWQAATTSGPDTGTLTISATGAVAGSSTRGCQFQGTVSPSQNGNLYDTSMSSLGGCAAISAQGIAYYDAASRRM